MTAKKKPNKPKVTATVKTEDKPKVRSDKEALMHIFIGIVNTGIVCPFCDSTMRITFSENTREYLKLDVHCDDCHNGLTVTFEANP
jgi:hypothetical protein